MDINKIDMQVDALVQLFLQYCPHATEAQQEEFMFEAHKILTDK